MGGLFVCGNYINYLSFNATPRQKFCRICASLLMPSPMQLHVSRAHRLRQKYWWLQVCSKSDNICRRVWFGFKTVSIQSRAEKRNSKAHHRRVNQTGRRKQDGSRKCHKTTFEFFVGTAGQVLDWNALRLRRQFQVRYGLFRLRDATLQESLRNKPAP